MCVSKFTQAFIFMLSVSFTTSLAAAAAAAPERVRMNRTGAAHLVQTSTQELDEAPGEPAHIERFMIKNDWPGWASAAGMSNSKAEEEKDPMPSGESSSIPGKAKLNIAVPPLFNSSSRRLTLIDKTYLDAYSILRESNSCSQFFGGTRIATSVLNILYPRLKETSLGDAHVAISMFGSITFGTDFQTGISYRLFQQALVNLRGPFYQSVNYRSQDFFNKIGHYPANTREARVAMLLHELGHLLRGADGRWLLQDDAGDRLQIAANTATIMRQCSEQIKMLRVPGQR